MIIYICILNNGISQQNIEVLSGVCQQYGAHLQLISTADISCSLKEQGYQFNFNISSFLRIFIADLLKSEDKALFIDSDTFVLHGIKQLYDLDLTSYPCEMALNQPIYTELLEESKLDISDNYYNAGVILFNLKWWRDNQVKDAILEFFCKGGGHFSLDDQSVINGVLAKSTYRLPMKYNLMITSMYWSHKRLYGQSETVAYTPQEYREAQKHPVIIHFNGPGIRPWERYCGHPYTSIFRKSLKRLFPDFKLKSPRRHKKVQLILKYLIHKTISPIEKIIHS